MPLVRTSLLLALISALPGGLCLRSQTDKTWMQAPAHEHASGRKLLSHRGPKVRSNGQEWEALGLVHDSYTQQFKVKEDNHFITKEYKFKLEQYEHPITKAELVDDIDAKLMRVDPHFFTMHGRATVTIDTQAGEETYNLQKPNVLNRRYSWRVTSPNDDNDVLFTITKRLWNDDCKLVFWKCKAVWKIYKGHRGDKSTLIYYGTGKAKDEDEPEFKFYHSKEEYESGADWVAKIEHEKRDESDAEDEFKVKVKPGEDAALILLSTVCIDKVADAKRQPEPEHEHSNHH